MSSTRGTTLARPSVISSPSDGWKAGWRGLTPGSRSLAAFTLPEVMIASGLGLLVLLAVATLSMFGGRSFVAMTNYVDMDQRSQVALDKMSREIRQSRGLTAFSSTNLTFVDANGIPVQFAYDADARKLLRLSNGETSVFLTGCDSLQFGSYQHTVKSNSFNCYDPTYVTDSKLIQVTWTCSRALLGVKANTESVQSAKIAIRN